jgi:predicted amidohydrolase
MKIPFIVAQFKVSLNVEQNLRQMLKVIEQAQVDDMLVFPEGALSGYSDDIHFLQDIDVSLLEEALSKLKEAVRNKRVYLFFGTCLYEDGAWFNAGICYSYNNDEIIYRKVNLAYHERGAMTAGNRLEVYSLKYQNSTIRFGFQLCRDIRFPEQWKLLALDGAQAFIYLTYAVDGRSPDVWRSHLISRAAENQRFVVSSNTAHAKPLCPTMIIRPNGEVITEILPNKEVHERHVLDLDEGNDWYLSQSRTDILAIEKRSL